MTLQLVRNVSRLWVRSVSKHCVEAYLPETLREPSPSNYWQSV